MPTLALRQVQGLPLGKGPFARVKFRPVRLGAAAVHEVDAFRRQAIPEVAQERSQPERSVSDGVLFNGDIDLEPFLSARPIGA